PDLEVVGIRGNVDRRLGRLYDADDDRRVDGLVLAAAGLERLGRLSEASELLDLATWPTAPAQGALALEVRADAPASLVDRVAAVDDPATRLAAAAERGVLAALEAGCSAPIAAHAYIDDGVLTLTATVYAPEGPASASREPQNETTQLTAVDTQAVESDRSALDLADRVAASLLDRGAARLAPLGGAR
ncbi:MAG TPA: hydroxymethylbilane synthase, partial [Microbacterium sp.]|nr:hydroxymethylbilane synthase [Microbacterium sp.]